MNAESREALIAKLQALPETRRAEVEDFIDFLMVKERLGAFDAFLAVADEVAKAGMPALSSEEVEAEIKALRARRRRSGAAGA